VPTHRRKPHTILHFCCDHRVLIVRGRLLIQSGYRVLNSGNGFEAIEWSTHERVDIVVLDLDHNRAEVATIAREIKRRRPKVPMILLTEGTALVDDVHVLADAVVPKEESPETLVKSLEKILARCPATDS
jgi:DNA-binding response OmpR family regulator